MSDEWPSDTRHYVHYAPGADSTVNFYIFICRLHCTVYTAMYAFLVIKQKQVGLCAWWGFDHIIHSVIIPAQKEQREHTTTISWDARGKITLLRAKRWWKSPSSAKNCLTTSSVCNLPSLQYWSDAAHANLAYESDKCTDPAHSINMTWQWRYTACTTTLHVCNTETVEFHTCWTAYTAKMLSYHW